VRLTPKDWVGAGFALLVAALFVRLGIWQLDRLHQRRAINAAVLARRALPPVTITSATLPVDSVRDRRVVATGAWDYAHERVWGARSYEGVPGVAVLTPLKIAGAGGVFVDRGWAPSADALHVDHAALHEGDSATVTGFAYAAPRGRGDVDPARLRDSIPYALAPFVIQAQPGHPERSEGLVRWPVPELSDGPHLFYAIQWFAFAGIVIVGMGAVLKKNVEERRRGKT